MLNFMNIKPEKQACHSGVRTAAFERDPSSSIVIGDWEAHSLAVMAQITAPLRLRGATCGESLT